MARGYMTFDTATNQLSYVPPWPPRPAVGDHWEKDGRRTKLSRAVVEVTLGQVVYINERGQPRKCFIEAFRSWCQGAKMLRRKNKKVVYADD
jgi:hypothetical protein